MVRYTESNPASTPAWTSPYTYSASTATTTSSSANNNRSFESNYQIPNMNVYINKATCRQLNIVHHPHTETNIHPATLLSRIHLNEGQLFYLRAHSAAYPIVTTLLALPPEDWFECRIYPSPNGIPSMIMPPPPITAPVITADTHAPSESTPTLNLSPIPIPTPLVHSCSLHSLLMSQSASPIDPSDTIWAKTSIPSPLPLMIDIDDDHWYLQDTDSPVTSIDTDSPVTLSSISPISSTPSSLPSSPSVNTFPSFLQPEAGSTTTTTTTLSQFPYPTVSSPTTINVQHVPLEMPQNQNSTPLTTRKRKSGGSPHTERSTPRKQEGHEEDEEQDSEVFTLSDIEERNSQPSSPAPLVLPTSAAEVFKRRKVLKKVYKKRYQQKSAIKRKIARFQATGDKAVVIFVTRNSQRKVGYDVEVYNPMKSSSDFLNPFWREQQSLVESYLRKHYAAKHTGEGETQQTQIHH